MSSQCQAERRNASSPLRTLSAREGARGTRRIPTMEWVAWSRARHGGTGGRGVNPGLYRMRPKPNIFSSTCSTRRQRRASLTPWPHTAHEQIAAVQQGLTSTV
jgi:hypothetical protein